MTAYMARNDGYIHRSSAAQEAKSSAMAGPREPGTPGFDPPRRAGGVSGESRGFSRRGSGRVRGIWLGRRVSAAREYRGGGMASPRAVRLSLAHGSAAAFAAVAAIAAQPAEIRGFAAPNTRLQDHVLDYSVAYFTMDLLHYLTFLPGDILFIAHHIATLFVFLTCRYVAHHGAYALLVLLFLAEVTSLLQNVWTLAGIWRAEVPFAARVYDALSVPFYVLYTIVRGVAGPIFFLKMSLFYLSGQALDVIPWWVRISWITVVGPAITVSILWIWNRWVELLRERKQSMKKKDT